MNHLARCIRVMILIALFSIPLNSFFAQDDDISVVGSGIAIPVVESLAEANETELTASVTGTRNGFAQLCDGTASLVASTRPISVEEDVNCTTNEVAYSELLIGHHILAFVGNPDATFTECLAIADLNTLYSPSAMGVITTWEDVYPADDSEDSEPTELSLYITAQDTLNFAILDQLINGDSLRADIIEADTDDILDAVRENVGALGVVDYESAVNADGIQILDVNTGNATGCSAPSPANVENRIYDVSSRLFIYVNNSQLESNEDLQAFLEFVVSSDGSDVIAEDGFSPVTDEALEANQLVLSGEDDGRTFSQGTADFIIPPNLAGQVTVGGSPTTSTFIETIATSFTSTQPNVTIDVSIEGQVAGLRRFCNGELDIVITDDTVTDADLESCEANDIVSIPFAIGNQATVLLSNANNDYSACLTTEQVSTLWISGTEVAKTWADVGSDFPDTELTLFAPLSSSLLSDLLLIPVSGTVMPMRVDTEQNTDPLYRAAATANVDGALTFMSWAEYQRVLDNEQANIQLVAVDSGDGCVAPSLDTIEDGSYPYVQSTEWLLTQNALANITVQSVLWTAFSDENFNALNRLGFVGLDFGDLPAIRDELQRQFGLAEEAVLASQPDVETTAEAPVVEATDEAPDIEATEESSDE